MFRMAFYTYWTRFTPTYNRVNAVTTGRALVTNVTVFWVFNTLYFNCVVVNTR